MTNRQMAQLHASHPKRYTIKTQMGHVLWSGVVDLTGINIQAPFYAFQHGAPVEVTDVETGISWVKRP